MFRKEFIKRDHWGNLMVSRRPAPRFNVCTHEWARAEICLFEYLLSAMNRLKISCDGPSRRAGIQGCGPSSSSCHLSLLPNRDSPATHSSVPEFSRECSSIGICMAAFKLSLVLSEPTGMSAARRTSPGRPLPNVNRTLAG